MLDRSVMLILALVTLSAGCVPGQRAPEAYSRCEKCHGMPGGGNQKGGPDLAESTTDLELFSKQVKLGSRWKGSDDKKQSYKWKQMPPQTGVSDKDIERIFKFVHAGK
ncbi:MAG: cytochrome c [Nitrospinota bacterium]|nr:cytochrome c [Nitrospinota bacterium]MDH5677684.1 cytochrome c [Nitrospinota bacterium]